MAGTSVSHLILFIAAITVAAGVAGTLGVAVSDISQDIDDRSIEVSKSIQTDVEIISDAGSTAVYNNTTSEITLLIKNTGNRALPNNADSIEVLVDGRYVPASSLSLNVLGGSDWRPGEVARLTANSSLSDGDHRAKIQINQEEELFKFFV